MSPFRKQNEIFRHTLSLGLNYSFYGKKKNHQVLPSVEINEKDSLAITFTIINDQIDVFKTKAAILPELLAEVTYQNLGENYIIMTESIIYGHKSDGYNHIEVINSTGLEIDVNNKMDYHYLLEVFLENDTLKPGQITVDTIDLSIFYSFGNTGEFNVRFVDTEFNISSNWDTLVVR